jgi:hypothetical protein
MKNKNKRELEKRWATEAAKKRKAAKKSTTRRGDVNRAAARNASPQNEAIDAPPESRLPN